jgi:integrase
MALKLSDGVVRELSQPASGNQITYDSEVKGFGCRVTANGARAFILNYRTRAGRERRYTIGQFPDWKTAAARAEAAELKKRIDLGEDPLAKVEADRNAKTVAELCERFERDHFGKLRPSTASDYRSLIEREIKPALKHLKVKDVTFSDVDGLHQKITRRGATYQANRTVAILSKMFALSKRSGWRTDNPCQGIERNQEQKRHRYLSADEITRLTKALSEFEDQQAANIVRLLLLTGSRRGEVLGAKWDQFDLKEGVWTKPGATTKQKTVHRVPLSAPARQLLSELRQQGEDDSGFVFPARRGSGHRDGIKLEWKAICSAAQISGARIHDLRHTYASMLASAGMSLPIIGALLGHSQPATTARYSHLMDDPLRQATERVGAAVMPKGGAQIVPLKGAGG